MLAAETKAQTKHIAKSSQNIVFLIIISSDKDSSYLLTLAIQYLLIAAVHSTEICIRTNCLDIHILWQSDHMTFLRHQTFHFVTCGVFGEASPCFLVFSTTHIFIIIFIFVIHLVHNLASLFKLILQMLIAEDIEIVYEVTIKVIFAHCIVRHNHINTIVKYIYIPSHQRKNSIEVLVNHTAFAIPVYSPETQIIKTRNSVIFFWKDSDTISINHTVLLVTILIYDAQKGRLQQYLPPGYEELYSATVRYNSALTSRDINGDGTVDIPCQTNEGGEVSLPMGHRLGFVNWYDYTDGDTGQGHFGILDGEYDFYLPLPESWRGRIQLDENNAGDGWVVRDIAKGETLVEVRVADLKITYASGFTRVGIIGRQQVCVRVNPPGEELEMRQVQEEFFVL